MTTSACSANANGLPDRRHFLSTLTAASAAAGALGLTAAPSLPGEPGPIEAMYAEHVRLAKARDAAVDAAFEAKARYVEPQRLPFRMGMEGRYTVYRVGNQNLCFVDDSDENIAELKALIATNPFTPGSADFQYHDIRTERAEKLLADIEAWRVEAARRADAAGLPRAKEIEDKLMAEEMDHAATIGVMEPTTFREIAFQAAVLSCTWDDAIADAIPDRLMKLAGIEKYWLNDAQPTSGDRRAA